MSIVQEVPSESGASARSQSAAQIARARAPASVGNAVAGFDILGHSVAGPHDCVTVRRGDAPGVRIDAIRGTRRELPRDPESNTAGAALLALCQAHAPDVGFVIEIDKGIPFASGMGGSAASAVAALVAANQLLDQPLPVEALYPFALAGEAAASGGKHGDNVGPMLLGGLVLATQDRLVKLPTPPGVYCALVHPHCELETRRARAVLQGGFELSDVVAQNAHLAQLLAGCHSGDLDLVRAGLNDVLVEPRRAGLIPGFAQVKQAALDAGALGGGISGAGPSLFAWCENEAIAARAAETMQQAFAGVGLDSDRWVSPLAGPAAEVIS